MNKNISYYKGGDALAIWAADVCSLAARQLICIQPTGLRLRHIGKTDPQCGTVQFCFHSGRLTRSAHTGFRAVTMPLLGTHYKTILEIWHIPVTVIFTT